MTCLPDVNVWIALAVGEHIHNPSAREWLDSVDDEVFFCRVTQMGLLRLLTNRQALGSDAFSSARAWFAFDSFLKDSRISQLEEPAALDHYWRAWTTLEQRGSNWWTDAYLAAFAATAGCTLVTFDVQLAGRTDASTLLLR
jgi:toxin-antitoxin system PIN domain toxin